MRLSRARIVAIALTFLTVRAAHAQPAVPTLTQIRDGIYVIQEGDQSGLVYVAPDGILIADPLSAAAGHWLAGELASKFPGRRIRFVVYLSQLFDRSVGGIAFPDAAAIGHADFNRQASNAAVAVGRGTTLPATLAALDANRDQRLDRSEWSRVPELSVADTNKDGAITLHEAARLSRYTRTTFRTGRTLTLGTKHVDVVNPGGSYSTAALWFADEKVLYVGTNPALAAGGFSFGAEDPHDMLAWLRGVAALPFDTILTAGGSALTRDRFDAAHQYAEALASAANAAYIAGRSLQQALADPAMQRFAGTLIDAQRRTNFDQLYRSFHVSRTEIQGAAIAQWMAPNPDFCSGYTNCETGGVVAGGSGGLRFVRSGLGLVIEGSSAQQFIASREGTLKNEAFAQRISRGSALFRVGPKRPSATSIELLAGPTLLIAQSSGVVVNKLATAPFGGRHPIEEKQKTAAITAGINLVLPVSRRWSVYLPVRATYVLKTLERMPDRLDVQAGAGLSLRLSQSVR
jgi:hypothetical protein